METSIFISKIIGIIYTSFGVGLLLNRKFYKNELPKLLENRSFLILGGFIAIIIGLLIIEIHKYWEKSWTVIITIIGWIALIKGILLLSFPKFTKVFAQLFHSKLFYNILAPMVIALGLIFLYFGFLS